MTYSEKLKDPRWQKMRLKILERDDWACPSCFGTEQTLHVHHMIYSGNRNPWEYPMEDLITLCSECHLCETERIPDMEHDLMREIKRKFLSADIGKLVSGFHQLELIHSPSVIASVLEYSLSSKNVQKLLIDMYFTYLSYNNDKEREELSHGSETSRNNTERTDMPETAGNVLSRIGLGQVPHNGRG
jgi:hypothetical protein